LLMGCSFAGDYGLDESNAHTIVIPGKAVY
jgi:hypothetical protein